MKMGLIISKFRYESGFSQVVFAEKIEIKSLKRGECLIFVGDEHILNKINAADFEKEIIENKINNLLKNDSSIVEFYEYEPPISWDIKNSK